MKQLKSNSPEITIDVDAKVVVSYKRLMTKYVAKYICRISRYWEEWNFTISFFSIMSGIIGCILSLVGDVVMVTPVITTSQIVIYVLKGGLMGITLGTLIPYCLWEMIQVFIWLKSWAEVNR